MKNKINKTAYIFFLCFIFITKQRSFSIEDIINHLNKNHKITLSKATILKYLRTMKFLGFKFKRSNNKIYILEQAPINLFNKQMQNNIAKYKIFFEKKLLTEIEVENKQLFEKIKIFLPENLIKKISQNKNNKYIAPEFYENLKNLKKYCKNGLRLKICFLNNSSTKITHTIEPDNIHIENDEYYLKGFDVDKKNNVLLNLKSICEITTTPSKNKYVCLKNPVTIKISGKFSHTYNLKNDEKIIKKSDDCIYIESFYYEKTSFFKNILRYMDNCEIISPQGLRNDFKVYLENLYQKYDCLNVK